MDGAARPSRGGTEAGALTLPAGLRDMVNRMLMAAMSRLAPLIVRRTGPWAAAPPLAEPAPFAGADAAAWLDDLKLFATGWIGGLIFFGTLLG